jgi:type I restriction enzyme S subunit
MINAIFPEGWTAKRLKYLATYNDEVLAESTDEETEIDYVEISSVSLSRGIEQAERISFGQAPSRARRRVRSGDILISTVRTYLRAIAKVDEASPDLVASTGFCVVRPERKKVDSGFLGWAAKSEPFVSEVVSRSVGVSYPAINASELVTIEMPLPPLETQRRIAQFLDEKTARIDGLIEKKRALLERLAEKRQALITRAVTKGLNPDAPMKHSGIDWLGDIPAHWEVRRLRYSVEKIEQGWSPQCDNRPAELGEWGVLKVGCVNGDSYDEKDNKALPADLDPLVRYEVFVGDILISRANTKELLGSAALVSATQGRIIFSDKLYRIHLEADIDPRFLIGILRSPLSRFQYEQDATGTSGSMQNIGQDTIKNLRHTLPPFEEQKRIGAYLDELLSKDCSIENAVESSIEKLQEYRSSLITAAVTGQIGGLQ